MKRIYITHCSAKKNLPLKGTGTVAVSPLELYTATPTQRFMNRCKRNDVNWAIFSDKYGVWHSSEKHEWYEKDPDRLTDSEFKELVNNFDNSLEPFDEIWFYHNPGRFHRLYKKLIEASSLKNRIRLFTHIQEIG